MHIHHGIFTTKLTKGTKESIFVAPGSILFVVFVNFVVQHTVESPRSKREECESEAFSKPSSCPLCPSW